MELETIRVETFGHITRLTLNRPERLNALNKQMRDELLVALRICDDDASVRVVILAGAGRAFSSGAELGGPPRETVLESYLAYEDRDRQHAAIRQMHKPVIAAVHGACYGAGLMIAAHCDFVVAAESARFGLIEARMGSTGVAVFPLLIGPQWSKFLMLAGEIIDARVAEKIGLVLAVVPDANLSERVLSLAERIVAMPPAGVLLNKRAIDGTIDLMGWRANELFNRSHSAVTDAMSKTAATADGRNLRQILREEGFTAFKKARDAPFAEPWLRSDK